MTAVLATVQIDTVTCYLCGVVFGMPADMLARRGEDGGTFWCPSGHGQHFTETEAQRLRAKLKRAESDRDYARSARDAWRDQHDAAERSRRALRGVITRQRNRAVAGMCPVDGCRRHFNDLGRHMASEHADFVTDAEHIDTAAPTAETGA